MEAFLAHQAKAGIFLSPTRFKGRVSVRASRGLRSSRVHTPLQRCKNAWQNTSKAAEGPCFGGVLLYGL